MTHQSFSDDFPESHSLPMSPYIPRQKGERLPKKFIDPDEAFIEAKKRIAQEAAAKTGKLDLCQLRINSLPEEITQLVWLEKLLIDNNSSILSKYRIDITPIKSLKRLTYLSLRQCRIDSCLDLSSIPQLNYLSLYSTEVAELKGLTALSQLQHLDVGFGNLTELPHLSSLSNLRWLSIRASEVAKLEGLEHLEHLQLLDVAHSKITQLKGLAKLSQLQDLDVSNISVTQLDGLEDLGELVKLRFNGLNLSHLPQEVVWLPKLKSLYCDEVQIANVPKEYLSRYYNDDCLAKLRKFFK